MVNVLIRPETEDDCDEAAAVHVLAWQRGYRGMLPDELLDTLDVAQWSTRRRQRIPDKVSLVAERDGRIVGFVRFGPDREDQSCGEIQAIYVHPDHWGTGVGGRLLRAAMEALPQREIRLWVLEENKRALTFYAHHGLYPDGAKSTFRPSGIEPGAPELRCALRRP